MTLENKVYYILDKHPDARSDDRVLYQYYLIYDYGSQFIDNRLPLHIIADAHNMDSLGRVRRKFQSVGMFEADEKTKKIRRDKEEMMRNV
jgi:hypothetical protein